MKKKALLPLFLGTMVFLAGCDYSKPEKRSGFFYDTSVDPMKNILDWLGSNLLDDNCGLAIIILVLIIRIILLPFMLSSYKNSHMMHQKMKVAGPEVEKVQEKVKRTRTREEKMAANQELIQVYKRYDMNPIKNMLDCLPVLIQLSIVMELYFVLRNQLVGGLFKYPYFLWFDLERPDIWITIIAGVLYFIQAHVSSKTIPDEQRQMDYMMMVISPIMIVWISLSSASALGLYWSVSTAFPVAQTRFANIYHEKTVKKEVQPFIETYEREHNGGSNKKDRNTQVVSKKKRK